MNDRPPLTYAEAGVSLDAADAVVERMRAAVESTRTPLVLGSLGGFAGLVSAAKFADPVLAAGTDTVGSKAAAAAPDRPAARSRASTSSR